MASALDTVRATIESRVSTTWAARTAIEWAGRPFTPPDGPWLRVTILFGDAFQRTMDGLNTTVGVLDCALFARQSAGLGVITQYADALRAGLEQLTASGVRFRVPSGPVEVGGVTGWTQLVWSVPFEAEETV